MLEWLFPPRKPPGPKPLYDGSVPLFVGKCLLGAAAGLLAVNLAIAVIGYSTLGEIAALVFIPILVLSVIMIGLAIAGTVNVLVGVGLRSSARQRVVSVLKGFGYVRIPDLAQQLDVSQASLEQFISRCINAGILTGRLDSNRKEYWSEGEQQYAEFAGYVQAYRRIRLDQLARKMGKTEFEVEAMLKHCLQRELLHGYIDRQAGEFMTSESIDHVEAAIVCPQCGAPEDRIVLLGEERRCEACGSAL
jgi:hypothetical protein